MSSVRTFFRHCPSCGRRFEIRLVSRGPVSSESIDEEEPRLNPVAAKARSPCSMQEGVPCIVDVEEFQYTYRCDHCGHEWTETHEATETFSPPKGYTGD